MKLSDKLDNFYKCVKNILKLPLKIFLYTCNQCKGVHNENVCSGLNINYKPCTGIIIYGEGDNYDLCITYLKLNYGDGFPIYVAYKSYPYHGSYKNVNAYQLQNDVSDSIENFIRVLLKYMSYNIVDRTIQ